MEPNESTPISTYIPIFVNLARINIILPNECKHLYWQYSLLQDTSNGSKFILLVSIDNKKLSNIYEI